MRAIRQSTQASKVPMLTFCRFHIILLAQIFVTIPRWSLNRPMFGLSDKDKYQITSWAFSYFMTHNLTISEAVILAVKKVKPKKVGKDGSIKLSESTLLELQLRIKSML